MAYKITDACLSCGTCKDACPVDAISEGADKYEMLKMLASPAVPVLRNVRQTQSRLTKPCWNKQTKKAVPLRLHTGYGVAFSF